MPCSAIITNRCIEPGLPLDILLVYIDAQRAQFGIAGKFLLCNQTGSSSFGIVSPFIIRSASIHVVHPGYICSIVHVISIHLFLGHTMGIVPLRSEEHTSELQSRENLVCRLLLEKKKLNKHPFPAYSM